MSFSHIVQSNHNIVSNKLQLLFKICLNDWLMVLIMSCRGTKEMLGKIKVEAKIIIEKLFEKWKKLQ